MHYIRSDAGLQKQTLTRDEGDPYLHAPKGGEDDEVKKLCTKRGLLVCGHDQWTPSDLICARPSNRVLLRPGENISNMTETQRRKHF